MLGRSVIITKHKKNILNNKLNIILKIIHHLKFEMNETEEYDDKTCPICLSYINSIDNITTKCNHSFHCHCINDWLQNNQTCPVCRIIVRNSMYNNDFVYPIVVINDVQSRETSNVSKMWWIIFIIELVLLSLALFYYLFTKK